MPRQVNLPPTAELFDDGRVDDQPIDIRPSAPLETSDEAATDAADGSATSAPVAAPRSAVRPSGRIRHDGKITVYLSSEELSLLEETRLDLRAEHGVAVDRGRIVRAAVAASVEDLRTNGPDSDLVTRLRQP
ncbi:MAG: hypothetical protein L0G99_17750 [Propionibacteriales bacterium]|nr:hypothetical protein [Propionibacteriales bacterium]